MNVNSIPGLPALVLHELTHVVAAQPFASVELHIGERPPLTLDWRPDTPRLWVWWAHLAPTILGILATALTVALAGPMLIQVLRTADPFTALAIGVLAAYNWLLYCWPSYEDRHPWGGDR